MRVTVSRTNFVWRSSSASRCRDTTARLCLKLACGGGLPSAGTAARHRAASRLVKLLLIPANLNAVPIDFEHRSDRF